jgi:zinc protease
VNRILATAFALLLLALPARAQIEITPVTSPGGITAWLYEDHSIPIVTLEASFRGGASLEPEGEEGATALMTALLEEGAGEMDATAFAEAREDLAARMSFDASRDSVDVSAEMLAENRDESLDLLQLALTEPRFDEAAVERVRAQLLASIRAELTDPRAIAGREFFARVYEGHPYARPVDGTLESVEALTVEELRAAHRRALTRDRLHIAVVGAITPEELAPLLDEVFGALPESGPPLPPVAEIAARGSLSVIDHGIPQSIVVFGHEGIPRSDPDFVAASVMDHILGGGGFGSRLTEEIREERGLSYGVGTYLAPNDRGWLYMGQFSSANERVAEALAILRAEWARMAEEGVTEAELEAAKKYLTGAYPLRFSSNGAIANQLLGLQIAGLGIGYVNERNDLVEAVTVEDIRRVADRLLDPDALTLVAVGRPEGLEVTN